MQNDDLYVFLEDLIKGAKQINELCEESADLMRYRIDTNPKDLARLESRAIFADDVLAILEAALMKRGDRLRAEHESKE